MYIKFVKEYLPSYCELVVTDHLKDVVCICDCVLLDNGRIPTKGMRIEALNAFFLDETQKIVRINNIKKQSYKLSKAGIWGMAYKLRGKIVDAKRYIVKVYDFYVSLEYLFSSEYIGSREFPYNEGEWIEFVTDRLDAIV